MQIKITACCGVHGEIVEPGEILDVDDPTGKMLVGIGKAEPFEETIQHQDPEIQSQDPTVSNQDPKPGKKR